METNKHIKFEKELKLLSNKENLKILKFSLFCDIIIYNEISSILSILKKYEEKIILIKKLNEIKIKIKFKSKILKKFKQLP